jgi:hypothetical protein
MGLIKATIIYGGLAYAVNAMAKNWAADHESKTTHSSRQSQEQQQTAPYEMDPQKDHSSHFHQRWCNGSCGGRCNTKTD